MSTDTTVDTDAVKQRQQGAWSAGDYSVLGVTLQIVGESLCESVDVAAGSQVLDVAAGNGNATLAAARRGCEVTAIDYVPALLERLQQRAAADGLTIDARTGDIEALDLPDDTFDTVLSTFGIPFTPDQEAAAAEAVRVCRPGGRIGLANWTPDSFVGNMLRIIGQYAPPPPGVRSPLEWGTEGRLRELFGGHIADLSITERDFVFRYRSPRHLVEVFRTYYGPMVTAFERIDPDGRAALESDLIDLASRFNSNETDEPLRIPSAYLEVVIDTV